MCLIMPQSPFETPMDPTYGKAQQLSRLVHRLTCENPGPFTHHGTNTYLLGKREIAVIDPGPVNEAHIEAILKACDKGRIKWIIMTHTHMDHSPNGVRLKEITGAKTVAFPQVSANRGMQGFGDRMVEITFAPDIPLMDGDTISSKEWTLKALHTPGHAPDHLCFALIEENTVFSGDHVMGWNTSIIAPPEGNIADYLSSLEKLIKRKNDLVYYPAHGGEIKQPGRLVKSLQMHRHIRLQSLIECMQRGYSTIDEFARELYRGTPEKMLPAAKLSLLAQVQYLQEQGKIHGENIHGMQGEYTLIKQ